MGAMSEFTEICGRLRLTVYDQSCLTGLSYDTIRAALDGSRSPKKHTAERIAAFVRLNKRAKRRSDLRLVDLT
jgi:hypothetical protein